ncbi:MAG TPA: hypothetical protein PK593_09085, partial [Thermomicrobiales bacterium]|nr:hypothetical protein [Thermomicrobiales bacterium]
MTLPAACRPASATEDGRTTSRKRIAIVGAIILLVLAGCGRSESAGEAGDITVRVTTDPAPAIVGPARIVMLLTDRSNTPISGATIR